MSQLRIVHVITTLDRAGAEVLLTRLVERLPADRFKGAVVCLGHRGDLAAHLEQAGWPVHSIGMSSPRISPSGLQRLREAVRREAPQVVHTWMYHADLVGGLVSKLGSGAPRVLWSLHQSALPGGEIRTSTRILARFNALLSGWLPDGIVSTSYAARDFHLRLGYDASKIVVVPSAFESAPLEERSRLHEAAGVGWERPTIVRVGRFHPQKDYSTFFQAISLAMEEVPDLQAVCIGPGVTGSNPDLVALVARFRVGEAVHLLGERPDAAQLVADADVAVSSSSFGESTPLVVGEALAAGVPVVATDVGDSRLLVGEAGRIVPPRDAAALAGAITDLLRVDPTERHRLGHIGRERIADEYSLPTMVARYVELYERLAGGCR